MLLQNIHLLFRLLVSELRDHIFSSIRRIIKLILWGLVFVGGFLVYRYYNRLDLIDSYKYRDEVFELYRDWSKSTYYYALKGYKRGGADNYYVIKKNDELYFKYQDNDHHFESYISFYFENIENDSLVLLKRRYADGLFVYLKMPINKKNITTKDIRIIPIYPGILKDGSEAGHTKEYSLNDYKEVPVEVIDCKDIISDY